MLPRTLGEALQLARGRIDVMDAKVLLREASGCSAAMLVGFPERELPEEASQRFAGWLQRREEGEPVAYIVGYREFFGHAFRVTPDTLIPRPDTELLVERAIALIDSLPLSLRERELPALAPTSAVPSPWGKGRQAGRGAADAIESRTEKPRILDLGTGTGAIAISIVLARDVEVTAIDASADALAVARSNAEQLGARVNCLHGNWFEPVAQQRFDLIVSNPPYIAQADEHLAQGDVRFEPRSALTAGVDGLDGIRTIVAGAPLHLKPEGWLLLEHGYDQAERVRGLLRDAGFADVQSWRDLAGIERVSGGFAGFRQG